MQGKIIAPLYLRMCTRVDWRGRVQVKILGWDGVARADCFRDLPPWMFTNQACYGWLRRVAFQQGFGGMNAQSMCIVTPTGVIDYQGLRCTGDQVSRLREKFDDPHYNPLLLISRTWFVSTRPETFVLYE